MALSFEEIKHKVEGQRISGPESFDQIKTRVSGMDKAYAITSDDVNDWFSKTRELSDRTAEYLSNSRTYDGWKDAASPSEDLHKLRLQEATVRAWMNGNKEALGEQYGTLASQLDQYADALGQLDAGVRNTGSIWKNSPLEQIDRSISANEEKMAEMRNQLEEKKDNGFLSKIAGAALTEEMQEKMHMKENVDLHREIEELEKANQQLQDERLRYLKAYNEAGLLSNPDALIPEPTLADNLDALRLDAAVGISSFSNGIYKALDWLIPDENDQLRR